MLTAVRSIWPKPRILAADQHAAIAAVLDDTHGARSAPLKTMRSHERERCVECKHGYLRCWRSYRCIITPSVKCKISQLVREPTNRDTKPMRIIAKFALSLCTVMLAACSSQADLERDRYYTFKEAGAGHARLSEQAAVVAEAYLEDGDGDEYAAWSSRSYNHCKDAMLQNCTFMGL